MSFDEFAKNWDTELRIKRAKVIAEEISRSISLDKNYSAMEFGCGTGLISFNIFDKFKNVTLIDSSKEMIRVVNSKIDNYNVKNMIPYHLDITEKILTDMKFDVIYNSMVLHHIPGTYAIIKSFYEMLNKDGYLCIVDVDEEDGSFHKNYPDYDGHNGFNHDALKSILRDAGFKDVQVNSFYFDEKVIEGEIVKYSLFLMRGRK